MQTMSLDIRQTITYLALGAVDHLRGLQDSPDAAMSVRADSVMDAHGGQINLLDEVTRWAETVEAIWKRQYAKSFNGVWLYDVVEEVGARIMDTLSEGNEVDADTVVALVQEIADKHVPGDPD